MKEIKEFTDEYVEDYGVHIKSYLTYSEIQAIANAATKFDTWAERNENIDILLIHFATDMDDKDIEELGHDKLLKSGLIDIVKSTVINFYEIDAAIAFAESPMRLLTKIAKEMPEVSKRVDEVMKNAPSKK